jgi:hypothetical protein
LKKETITRAIGISTTHKSIKEEGKKMKLLTSSIMEKLQRQYLFGIDISKQDVVVKIYDPCGPWTWYLLNQNPGHPDELKAIVRGNTVDVAVVSFSELEAYRNKPLGLPLDRDPYFMPRPAKEVWDKLLIGKES